MKNLLSGLVMAALAGAAGAETLEGRAQMPSGVQTPGGATFEAVLEDISLADAPAVELGRSAFAPPQTYGWPFSIDYDTAALDPRHSYAVRGRVTGATGQLLFVTDTVVPVLEDGADAPVLNLVAVAGADQPVVGAHGLRLPATFTGTLPCADCEGIAHHLDLWPDQTYHLRRIWQGKTPPLIRDEVGRWYVDPARAALVLHGAAEMPLQWEIQAPDRLRALDMQGKVIDSDLPYELQGTVPLEETDLDLPLQGLVTYFADAAQFEVCLSGKTYPVEMSGDYPALERAYGEARPTPGAPLLATVMGRLELRPAMEGPDRRSLIVDRFVSIWPEGTCDRHRAPTRLENTYWRIAQLNGETLTAQPGGREPHLLLRGGADNAYQATVGCNGLGGSYTRDSENGLRFERGMSTLMACPPPLDGWEQAFAGVLGATRSWDIAGQSLMLLDDNGDALAVLDAVYLP
ncbi:META domain-containing protein [Fluviibacterium sp. DFM31]|uniref:META domain-containing protein n=1 Tax=Meridianimarinicoccus marinus TaxID=3231483 RepID=A0ABV3L6W3_9RHOB